MIQEEKRRENSPIPPLPSFSLSLLSPSIHTLHTSSSPSPSYRNLAMPKSWLQYSTPTVLIPFAGEMDTGGGVTGRGSSSTSGFAPVTPSGGSSLLGATTPHDQQQQLQLLMLLQHNIAAQQQAAAAAAAAAAAEPLSVLSSRGYKRKLSSIDGLPPSLEGTLVGIWIGDDW